MFYEKHRALLSKWLDEQDIPDVLIQIILTYLDWVIRENDTVQTLGILPLLSGFLIRVPAVESKKSLLELIPVKDCKRYHFALSAFKCRSFHCVYLSEWTPSPDSVLVLCFEHGIEFQQMLSDSDKY